MNSATEVMIEEIIIPGMSSFEDKPLAEVILEVDDIVRCSCSGVGLDLALELCKQVDWTLVMEAIEKTNKTNQFN